MDKLILDGRVYTTNDPDKLPYDLQPEKLSTVVKDNVTAFYAVDSTLSNHYHCKFTTDEGTFTSVELYFIYKKATMFHDGSTAKLS